MLGNALCFILLQVLQDKIRYYKKKINNLILFTHNNCPVRNCPLTVYITVQKTRTSQLDFIIYGRHVIITIHLAQCILIINVHSKYTLIIPIPNNIYPTFFQLCVFSSSLRLFSRAMTVSNGLYIYEENMYLSTICSIISKILVPIILYYYYYYTCLQFSLGYNDFD